MQLHHCSSLCIVRQGKTQKFLNRILGHVTEMIVVMVTAC
jgi:hypothetical protein